jgi:pantoate--beta-alanine ligase
LALIRRGRRLARRTVVSIFVNPTQFAPGEDFEAYPRTWRQDLKFCRSEHVDCVFAPNVETLYPDGFDTTVTAGALGRQWEGAVRPGHFDGVATVVLKLFNIVAPHVAVFGQKDYQQSVIIRDMIEDLDLPIRLVVVPTVREPGGLALSSRNIYLGAAERAAAVNISRSLRWAADRIRKGAQAPGPLRKEIRRLVEADRVFNLDYVGFCDPKTLEPQQRLNRPLVILIAAQCVREGDAYGRRYIDNITVR